jgi:Zinc carboxypeptidase
VKFVPWSSRRAVLAAALVAFVVAAGPARAVSYDKYHRFSEVAKQLEAWAQGHPEAKLLTIGRSAGGRPIYVLRVAAPGDVDPDARPALFVGANAAGFHNAGTEAALHLLRTLLEDKTPATAELLRSRTFYVAPALDPDAHDALFEKPRRLRGGNAQGVDHDNDGAAGEDGPDDLDGDGVITSLRLPDPTGEWLPDPDEPRLMVKSDPQKERVGAFRIVPEGRDDDGDGRYNEDAKDGVWMDKNFPHAFPHGSREAGPWPSYAPETKAVLDFLFPRRNVAVAVIYGPANNLLAAPQPLGGNADSGTIRVTERIAGFTGLEANRDYTLDEIWDVVKDAPFVRQNNVSKEQLGQFLGGGAANKVDADDQAYLDKLAVAYKERLKKAGLSDDRPGKQYGGGGITPWLYYQYGAMAIELDVWGIPKPEKKEAPKDTKDGAKDEPLTLDRFAAMTTDEAVALGPEKLGAFLKDNKVPAQFDAAMMIGALKGGKATPKAMADRIRSMGGGGASGGGGEKGKEAGVRERDVLAWVDAHAPEAFVAWKPVTLPDGTKGEVGGLDPFVEIAPPTEILAPALAVHTETVLDLARKMARIEIVSLTAEPLGDGVYRVKAVAANRGFLPSHTKLAERARAHLPVRLEIHTGGGVTLVTNHVAVVAERLDGRTGTLEAQWLVRAEPGAKIEVAALSDNAGRAGKSLVAGKGGAK